MIRRDTSAGIYCASRTPGDNDFVRVDTLNCAGFDTFQIVPVLLDMLVVTDSGKVGSSIMGEMSRKCQLTFFEFRAVVALWMLQMA